MLCSQIYTIRNDNFLTAISNADGLSFTKEAHSIIHILDLLCYLGIISSQLKENMLMNKVEF